jgi:murein DD-endopeptidase MepM/ murein hydrolase activator NlpD
VNGVQTSITYVEETVTVEPVAQVVSVGTLTPPTYLKPVSGIYSSGFGYRDGSMHKGVDWSCSTGTPVYAAASGTVIRAGWYSGYGYCVDIRHSDGSMTRYGHLSSVAVSVGQTVNQSSLIAYSGNTGDSSGPHLHFEIWINGVAVNPLNYVNKN